MKPTLREIMLSMGYTQTDARLIAAAPDLLEACKTFIEEWEDPAQPYPDKSLELIRAAIAKAEED